MTPDPRLDQRIGLAVELPNARATAPAPSAERVLGRAQLAAIRTARATLLDAARRGSATEIEAGIAPFVRAMRDADFSRPTICSLVVAAIDAGLPTGRGAARRAQRAQAIVRWTRLAGELADADRAR